MPAFGTGMTGSPALGCTLPVARPDAPAARAATGDELLVQVNALTQAERQRLYEELYRRWNCRIYNP